MGYSQKEPRQLFREVYTDSREYLGSMYFHYSARKWAIKEYPGQWFAEEEGARDWLMKKNQPTIKG